MFAVTRPRGDEAAPPLADRPAPAPEATPAGRPERRAGDGLDAQTRVEETAGRLAIGITEFNPVFVHPVAPAPGPFERWRRALQRMGPDFYRLVVDWQAVQDGLDVPVGGCMRDVEPCAGYAGLRGQLEALAAAQESGGWETMVVFTGTPDRYARAPRGCERAGTEPRSRAFTRRGLRAYRALIRGVQAEAARAGARLRYWSPWNEPNHPYGLSPQRAHCSAAAPSAVNRPYAEMARVLAGELRDDQELVLGELAGLLETKAGYVPVGEFIRGLPRALVCQTSVFGQHAYVGGPDPVDEVARALRGFDCPTAHAVWITETGAWTKRRGASRRAAGRHACRSIRRRLLRWYEDPRVTAAFQYTLREDDLFPTGLVTVDLARAYPALAEWIAWGRRDSPHAPPPARTC